MVTYLIDNEMTVAFTDVADPVVCGGRMRVGSCSDRGALQAPAFAALPLILALMVMKPGWS